MRKILVGYDGSGPSREAARTAGLLAKGTGAGVTVLTVGQVGPLVLAPTGMMVRVAEEADFLPVAQTGVQVVEATGSAAEARAFLGDPADGLVETAAHEGYDLVVVGHRGMSEVADLVLGSVAKRAAEEAPCPVLVVKDRAPEAMDRILVGIDGSPHGRRAAESAVELAAALGAEVTLLYAIDPKVLGAVADRDAQRQMRHAVERTGRGALEDAAQLCQEAGVAYKTVLATGRPAETILKRAHVGHFHLIAVGRRGLGGVARLRLGSVSDEVLRNATCPVLMVGERAKSKAPTRSRRK